MGLFWTSNATTQSRRQEMCQAAEEKLLHTEPWANTFDVSDALDPAPPSTPSRISLTSAAPFSGRDGSGLVSLDRQDVPITLSGSDWGKEGIQAYIHTLTAKATADPSDDTTVNHDGLPVVLLHGWTSRPDVHDSQNFTHIALDACPPSDPFDTGCTAICSAHVLAAAVHSLT